jgi:hypothetical protein
MSDDDKSPKPRFEPPPWEVEAFQALAAKRAEQKAAKQEDDEASSVVPISGLLTGAARAQGEPGAEGVDDSLSNGSGKKGGQELAPDAKVVDAMIMQLAREEASDRRSSTLVTWVATVITALLGVSMMIGGISVASQSHGMSTALVGSGVLVVFGLSFIGMAAWVWVSTNRARGR